MTEPGAFTEEFSDGCDRPVVERGVTLSGGQRQRVVERGTHATPPSTGGLYATLRGAEASEIESPSGTSLSRAPEATLEHRSLRV